MSCIRITLALISIIFSQLTGFTQKIGGHWEGKLQVAHVSLKIQLHIYSDQNKVTFDSPDQGAFGFECVTNALTPDSISVSLPQIGMKYAGSYRDEQIIGKFSQNGLELPLDFTRMKPVNHTQQLSSEPATYSTEEVKISNPEGNSVLAGTLTIPENASKLTPLVVMVTGSGLQNRDEELFGHKPFAVIADFLARNGVASLRYDDRGFGESTGDANHATSLDFASDAKAVAQWAKNQKRFGKIGILGHSEGGQIAYLLGADKTGYTPEFIISVAGPVVKGTVTIADQNRYALLSNGVPEDMANAFSKGLERVLEELTSCNVPEIIDESMLQSFYPGYNSTPIGEAYKMAVEKMKSTINENEWMKYFMGYDPQESVKGLTIPTMIIYGEKDRQVAAGLNAPLAQTLSPNAEIKVYPDLNHAMQHAQTGAISEYATIEETFAPEVLADIVKFITKAVGNASSAK